MALNASILGERGQSSIYACLKDMEEIWARMTDLEIEETKTRVKEQVQHFLDVQEILERPVINNAVVERIIAIAQ